MILLLILQFHFKTSKSLLASSFFFSPNFKLKYAEAPSPNIKANASAIIFNGNTTFVAPFPKYPTPHPINIWSTILYNEFTTSDIIHGIENFLINLIIFSLPNMFSSFSISIFASFSYFQKKNTTPQCVVR